MSTQPTVVLYCQHALGMGYLVRCFELAAGLAERSRVVLLNGGPFSSGIRIHPDIEVVDLPPLGFDSEMRLVSRDRRWTAERGQLLRREPRRLQLDFDGQKNSASILEQLGCRNGELRPPLRRSAVRRYASEGVA